MGGRSPSTVRCCVPKAASGTRSTAHRASGLTPPLTKRLIGPASGWHALVYSWKLHLVAVVASVWFPIVALLTPANVADSEPAPALLAEVPAEVRFVLGDRHYNTPDLHESCQRADRLLVATMYGR